MNLALSRRARSHHVIVLLAALSFTALSCSGPATDRFTTRGQDIIDPATGQPTLLTGFGLGGWLLPEGYMWGIRTLDRPRQFEAAIEDLVGAEDAAEFWRLYHDNFVTAEDFKAMRAFGANSVRIPLLASQLQPRDEQPDEPPFVYSPEGFRFLDSVVVWSDRYDLGVIWDMHGAPGGQNAENISDSDGEARLWNEKNKYWPRLMDLW
jgi:aryl-phospho-beta-D-glucosidase BglC (GH1 family)